MSIKEVLRKAQQASASGSMPSADPDGWVRHEHFNGPGQHQWRSESSPLRSGSTRHSAVINKTTLKSGTPFRATVTHKATGATVSASHINLAAAKGWCRQQMRAK